MNIRPQTIRAACMLTDALAELRHAAELADHDTETTPHGSREERFSLELSRVVKLLGDAVASVPTQLWLAMCNASAEAIEPKQQHKHARIKTAKAA